MAERYKPLPRITRERLNARKAIAGLEWVEAEIRERLKQLDLAEVPALKLYADIQRWKIDKTLPDLKQVEFQGSLTQEVIVRFNPE